MGFAPRFHRGPFGTLAAIRDTRCDMVLLDVNMPSLDGPALVRVIRHTYGDLPIFLYSNMERPILDRIARHIGANGGIPKYLADEELGRVLHEAFAREELRATSRARACE